MSSQIGKVAAEGNAAPTAQRFSSTLGYSSFFSHNGKAMLLEGQQIGEQLGTSSFYVWVPGHPAALCQIGGAHIYRVAFSTDDSRCAVSLSNGVVRVWDVGTGTAVASEMQVGDPANMSFSSDRELLLTQTHPGNSVRIWDAQTGRALTQPVRLGVSEGRVSFSNNARSVVLENNDGKLKAWDILSYEYSHSFGSDGSIPAWCLLSPKFTADGKLLLAQGPGAFARFFDTENFEPVAPPIDDIFPCLSLDGRRLAKTCDHTSATLGDIQVFDVPNGVPISPIMMSGMTSPKLSLSGDGKMLLAVDNTFARVWNTDTGTLLSERRSGRSPDLYQSGFWCGAISADGRHAAASGSEDVGMTVWETATGTETMRPFTGPNTGSRWTPTYLEFLPNSHRLVSVDVWGRGRGWTVPEGTPLTIATGASYAAAFSPDQRRVVRTDDNDITRVWDTITGRPLTPNLDATEGVFSPDGKWIAGGVRVYDSRTGRPVTPPLEIGSKRARFAFSPNSKSFAATADNGQSTLYPLVFNAMNLADLEPLVELLAGKRIDEVDGIVELPTKEWDARFESLRTRIPEFFRPSVERSEAKVSARYRQAVEARLAAAKTDVARLELAKSLANLSEIEAQAGLSAHTILLAETALKLDPSQLIASENLAWACLYANRHDEALAIYKKCAGRRLGNEESDHAFGSGIFETISDLRKTGKDHPALAKIEAILAPTTRPTTQPATHSTAEPASRPASSPATHPS